MPSAPGAGQSLKMASTSRFREVSEDDIGNVLQSAIPEKTKRAKRYGMKIFKGQRTIKHRVIF